MQELPDDAPPAQFLPPGPLSQPWSDSFGPPEHCSTLSPPTSVPPPWANEQVVLILVGLIASGKSTFSKALELHFPAFRRCSQDDLGDRKSVEALARWSLRQGLSVCVDRTNFDESQRATWINIAREFAEASVWVLVFDTPYEVCAARLADRTGHPTITSPEQGMAVLQRFQSLYRPPSSHEGYTRILYLKPTDFPDTELSGTDVRNILQRLHDAPAVLSTATPPQSAGAFGSAFGGFRGRQRPRGDHGNFQPPGSRGGSARGGGWRSHGGYAGRGAYQQSLQWNGSSRPGLSSPSTWGRPSSSSPSGSNQSPGRYRDGRTMPGYDRTEENWRR